MASLRRKMLIDGEVEIPNEIAINYVLQKRRIGGRIKVLLETLPVHKQVDIIVASFEVSFEELLSMLNSMDVKVRISKASELVDRHLQSIRVAEKITEKVAPFYFLQ